MHKIVLFSIIYQSTNHRLVTAGVREAEGVYRDAAPVHRDPGRFLERALGPQRADRSPPHSCRHTGTVRYARACAV